jgi:hypothetical protein
MALLLGPGVQNCDNTSNFFADVACIIFTRFIAQKIQRDTQGYKFVPLNNLP